MTEFKDTARAGMATITINSGVSNQFFNDSSAGGANITVNSGAALDFYDNANRIQGCTATIINSGGASFLPGSETDFYNASTAGSAAITNASNAGAGGTTIFHDHSDAGNATITTGTTGGAVGTTHFYDSSSAANGLFTTVGGSVSSGAGAKVQFHNSSTAGSGAFMNNGAAAGINASGAELDFLDTSTADNATIVNNGSPTSGGNGALTVFSNGAKAGTANITNNSATLAGGNIGGGYTYFNSGAGADQATIINNGSAFNSATAAGHTVFNAGSTADRGTFFTSGATTSIGKGGEIDILDGASAGNGMFTNDPATVNGGTGGFVNFIRGGSTAANATFINNGGAVSGAGGGATVFSENSTAGNATVTANGGTAAGALGATIGFFGNPDAGSSTLIANGGTNGGAGGLIVLIDSPGSGEYPTGGTSRIVVNAGGTFDSSGAGLPLTVGSIEGAGQFLLGGGTLIAGVRNTDTIVSGIIANGGNSGGSNASLTKTGTGKLTLTGLNTYSGPTTITGGMISTNVLPNGGLAGGIGQSSNSAVNLVLDGGLLQYVGSGSSTNRLYSLGTNGGGLDSSGAGPIDFSNLGAVAFTGSGPRTFTLSGDNAGGNTLRQVIGNGVGGSTSLLKSGPGAWLLAGVNSYGGGTTIGGGVLGIATDSALGSVPSSPTTNIAFSGNGTLHASAAVNLAANRNIAIANGASASFDTGGNAMSIAGAVTNAGALVKTGAGTLEIDAAPIFATGSSLVAAVGTLRLNVTSGSPSIASGVTATVASGATLELAGSVSALGTAGGNRVPVANNSLGAAGQTAGLVVSGTNQVVGGIDGSGSTAVAAGSDLTANRIVQGALIIGGTAANPALVTIAASDATGAPLADDRLLASVSESSIPFASGIDSTSLIELEANKSSSVVNPAIASIDAGGSTAVPEPSTLLLSFIAAAGLFAFVSMHSKRATIYAAYGKPTAARCEVRLDRLRALTIRRRMRSNPLGKFSFLRCRLRQLVRLGRISRRWILHRCGGLGNVLSVVNVLLRRACHAIPT